MTPSEFTINSLLMAAVLASSAMASTVEYTINFTGGPTHPFVVDSLV